MTTLVPFDGSELSVTALRRAAELAEARDEPLVVVTVFPTDSEYARERGWPSDADTVERQFRQRVHELAPDATFRFELAENEDALATAEMIVVRTIRQVAAGVDASVVVVGSENAGRVTTPLSSVGSPVSEDPRYDVYIARHPD